MITIIITIDYYYDSTITGTYNLVPLATNVRLVLLITYLSGNISISLILQFIEDISSIIEKLFRDCGTIKRCFSMGFGFQLQ